MVSSVVKGAKSGFDPLPPNVVGLNLGPARFVERCERIPPFLFADAVAHDVEQDGGKGKGRVVLQAPLHRLTPPCSCRASCSGTSSRRTARRPCEPLSASPRAAPPRRTCSGRCRLGRRSPPAAWRSSRARGGPRGQPWCDSSAP